MSIQQSLSYNILRFLQNADMRFFATWSTAATKLAATTSAFGANLLKSKYNKEYKYNRNNKYNRNHKYNQKCKYIGITNTIWKTNIAFGKGCVCQKLGGHCWTNSLSWILDLGLVILWWRFPDPDYSSIPEWAKMRKRQTREKWIELRILIIFLFQNEEKWRKANREDDEDDEAGAQEGHPRDAQDFHTLGENKNLVDCWGEGAGGLKWILKL